MRSFGSRAGYVASIASMLLVYAAGLMGCGVAGLPGSTTGAARLRGTVQGGQQPIVGSKVYLYAAGTSGYGSAGRSLLPAPGYVVTNGAGGFSVSGGLACGGGDLVYALASGGDAGGGSNHSIALLAALGPCSGLSGSSFVTLNEATTVAAVLSLAPYIGAASAIGAPAGDVSGMTNGFANAATLANLSTGTIYSTTPAGGGAVPAAELNSLANSLAACVNSNGAFGACGALFASASYAGITPTDTVAATRSIVQHPLNGAAAIFALAAADAPFQPGLAAAPASWAAAVSYPGDVLTYHNDNARTGAQQRETQLTAANVNSTSFGKLRSLPVDGELYAQPLYVGQYRMADGLLHNVVFASTSHGSVYAFDADGNNPAQGYLWQEQLVGIGELPVAQTDYGCGNPSPEAGIIGTPVIDRMSGTLYVISKTKLVANGSTSFYQRLHALNLADGAEKFGGPTVIAATVPGTGDSAQGGVVSFATLQENERAALLLDNGTVWIAWASHCDIRPYHGWLLGYDAAQVSHQVAVYNNTPNGNQGGIWMGIGGPSADGKGNVFFVGGNGTFDANTGGMDLADAAIRIASPNGGGAALTALDYFVPSNQQALSNADLDVGVTNALLFHDGASTVAPDLAVIADKIGRVYLLNQANLGRFDTGSNGVDGKNGDVQDFAAPGLLFNNFAWLQTATGGTLFVGSDGQPMGAYEFFPGGTATAGHLGTTPVSSTAVNFAGGGANGGGAPTISSNGGSNAIVWALGNNGAAATLYAFDAANLATELYSSAQAGNGRDAGPPPMKFSSPVVGGGKVFVAGANALVVYGLLP